MQAMHRFIFYILIICLTACTTATNSNNNSDSIITGKVADTTITDTSSSVIISPPPEIGIKKVGYILDFRIPASVPAIRFKQCNVIIFAFGYVNTKGLYFKHPENLVAFSKKAKDVGCRILLGVSGSHSMFKYITATTERRDLLINQLMQAVDKYELDGVDIDWEFPSIKDKTNEAFTAFLKELSDSCHVNAKYYLSCAVTPGVNGGRRSSAINAELLTGNWVAWFNVMVYDDFSEKYPYQHHSNFTMAVTSFKYWLLVRKMKKEKCVMGLPLYERPSGIKQQGRVKTYATILQSGCNPYKDSAVIKIDTTKVKDSLTQYTIYYDGINTIKKKTRGAIKYGGGVMFWEIGQDVNSKYSLIGAAVKEIAKDTTQEKKITRR